MGATRLQQQQQQRQPLTLIQIALAACLHYTYVFIVIAPFIQPNTLAVELIDSTMQLASAMIAIIAVCCGRAKTI